MNILLPPSEGKRRGGRGKPLSHKAPDPLLAEPRAVVARALATLLSDHDRSAVAGALALPGSVIDDSIADNLTVASTRTMAALDRYAGVVYDGLAASQLSPPARRLADKRVLVFSGLFGVVAGGERIPSYRVPAKAILPGLGIVGTFWRSYLAAAIPALARSGPLVDLRSSDYAAMWQPARTGSARGGIVLADRVIAVRILSPRPDGTFGVVSYPSKYHKGRLAAALLEREAHGEHVCSAEDIVDTWASLGGLDGSVRNSRTGLSVELRSGTATVVGSAV